MARRKVSADELLQQVAHLRASGIVCYWCTGPHPEKVRINDECPTPDECWSWHWRQAAGLVHHRAAADVTTCGLPTAGIDAAADPRRATCPDCCAVLVELEGNRP